MLTEPVPNSHTGVACKQQALLLVWAVFCKPKMTVPLPRMGTDRVPENSKDAAEQEMGSHGIV